ncbi:MAG: NlpC/P60 family protein [Chitinophagaceae bacterium]|nr:MAG: NlpC/P60 family protein [Chitinophagaceae bacterium]
MGLRNWIIGLLLTGSFFTANAQDSKKIDASQMWARMQAVKDATYKWAGATEKGFDCSGFVQFVFKGFGLNTGHSTRNLAVIGKMIPLAKAQFGDVIVFTGTDSKKRQPGHAGIVVSQPGEPLKFMHSSSSKKNYGVTTTVYKNSNYAKRFLEVRRVANVL